MSFTGPISEYLTREELLDLASLYHEIQINSSQVVALACAFRMPVAGVYTELVRVQREIAEKVKAMREAGAK